jgi:hypothetical protein
MERYVVHKVPETSSTERLHEMREECWCFPAVHVTSDGVVEIRHRFSPRGEKLDVPETRERFL